MGDYFWTTVCPILGLIISNCQSIPPLNAILICRKIQDLGPLNPVPWAMGTVNCFCWFVYGALLQNAYVMLSLGPGVMVNFFATTSAISIMASKGQFKRCRSVEYIVLGGILIWLSLGFVMGTLLSGTPEGREWGVGLAGNVCSFTTICFYSSSASELREVVRRKDSCSLYLPALLVNLVAASLWALYGFLGFPDINLKIAQGTAVVVTLVQILMKVWYPSSTSLAVPDSEKQTVFGGAPYVDPIELMSLTDSAIASAAKETAADLAVAYHEWQDDLLDSLGGMRDQMNETRSRANSVRTRAGTLDFWTGQATLGDSSAYASNYTGTYTQDSGNPDSQDDIFPHGTTYSPSLVYSHERHGSRYSSHEKGGVSGGMDSMGMDSMGMGGMGGIEMGTMGTMGMDSMAMDSMAMGGMDSTGSNGTGNKYPLIRDTEGRERKDAERERERERREARGDRDVGNGGAGKVSGADLSGILGGVSGASEETKSGTGVRSRSHSAWGFDASGQGQHRRYQRSTSGS